MVVKLSLMSWMDRFYLLLTLLYVLVKVLEDPLMDFMCLVFTADTTVRADKGPGGSGDGVQNKFELLNILKDEDPLTDLCVLYLLLTLLYADLSGKPDKLLVVEDQRIAELAMLTETAWKQIESSPTF